MGRRPSRPGSRPDRRRRTIRADVDAIFVRSVARHRRAATRPRARSRPVAGCRTELRRERGRVGGTAGGATSRSPSRRSSGWRRSSDGPLVWVVALLLLAATILGTLQLLAEVDGPDAERGVPIERLIVPAVAALGAVGAIRFVPLGPAIVRGDRGRRRSSSTGPSSLEARIVGAAQGPTADDRTARSIVIARVALVAFAGVAASVPGGLAGLGAPGGRRPSRRWPTSWSWPSPMRSSPAMLGYRTAALRVASPRDVAWAALTSAAVIAIGAAGIRAIGVPRLVGPAVLMLLFYLWDTLHAAPPSRRRDPRWIWETAILAGLGVAVVAWNPQTRRLTRAGRRDPLGRRHASRPPSAAVSPRPPPFDDAIAPQRPRPGGRELDELHPAGPIGRRRPSLVARHGDVELAMREMSEENRRRVEDSAGDGPPRWIVDAIEIETRRRLRRHDQ